MTLFTPDIIPSDQPCWLPWMSKSFFFFSIWVSLCLCWPADAPIAVDISLLQDISMRDRLAGIDSLPQDPRLAPSAGSNLHYLRVSPISPLVWAPPQCSLPDSLGVTNGEC